MVTTRSYSIALFAALGVVGCACVRAPAEDDRALARWLSSSTPAVRSKAVAYALASSETTVPLVLRWTEAPPAGIDDYEDFYLSLNELLVKLPRKEAVPYLVRHISLGEATSISDWRSAESITRSLPAVQALLRIGDDSTPELLRALDRIPYSERANWSCASWDNCKGRDRVAIVVTLAQLYDPRARSALEKESMHNGPDGEAAAQWFR